LLVLIVTLDLLVASTQAALEQTHLARLVAQRDEREAGVKRVLDLLHAQRHLKASLQIVQALLHFLIAGLLIVLLATNLAASYHWLVWGGIIILLAFLLIGLEQVFAAWVCRAPEKWAIRLAPIAAGIRVLFSPFTKLFLLLQQQEEEVREGTVTEDELKSLVDAGQEDGVLEQDEREMIYSIFQLGDTLAREIMVPRIYITGIDVSLPLPQAVEALLASGHSRLPVYEDTIDHIVGLLYAKDLLGLWLKGDKTGSLRGVTRPAYFVPEAKKVDELLDEMQARRIHMAIVIDEYGGVAGLVTLEDIVEEIIGEVRDEYDQSEEAPYQQVGEGEYIFLGRVDLDDFNELMGTALLEDEADTIGGFMYNRIGRVPASGESIRVGELELTIEQVSGRRIRKIRARKIIALPGVEGEKDDHE
jgi:CBS domain containing-hemolysin-like protein